MKKRKDIPEKRVKQSLFPPSIFAIFLGILLLMSGMHTGLILLGNHRGWNDLAQIIIPVAYWGIVAVAMTLFTRRKIKRTYDEPMHQLAEATKKVANGDFSVYIPAFHTPDKLDYLDVMILDFDKMVEELGSIETLKTDFVSNVSHEMKTPIAIIKNYAELLQMDGISEKQRKEYGQSIEAAALRLSNLISNILKLSKLENQRMIPEVETYDVCRQLCQCAILFEDAWEEKEIELETDMEDSAMIKADQSLLELVWNNLLSNAVKFTEPEGTIGIRQTTQGKLIRISIWDTGCGMSQETARHIFDKFYQGDTSHSKTGNGLGLAMVKRIMELLDGEIKVVSQDGKGSNFTVTLPAADPAEKRHG